MLQPSCWSFDSSGGSPKRGYDADRSDLGGVVGAVGAGAAAMLLLCLFCVGTIGGIGVILGRQLTNQQEHVVGVHAAALPVAGDPAQLLGAVGEAT